MKGSKQSSERIGSLGYRDLLSKFVQNGLPEGDNSKSSSTLQGKGDSRFLENSMSSSRQDTSGATEGPPAEPDYRVVSGMDGTVVDQREPPSVPTPKGIGTGIIRGRALRTEDVKLDGFPRSLLKSRGMDTKARTGVQSPMLSFRSLLEGAISASGVQSTASVQGIAESGLQYDGLVASRTTPRSYREGKVLSVEGMPKSRQGERNFALRAHDSSSLSGGDSVPHVSYSSLLQAQFGDDPVEVRTDPSCKRARTLRSNVEAHSPPVKFQLQSAEVEGGFLALLNQTTRSLAPVAQRPNSPRSDSVSIGGRISDVHSSEKLLQGVASRSAEIVSERDGSDSLRATAVPASAVLASSGDVPEAEAVVERRSSVVADSMCSDEDASGTPLPEEGNGPLAVNESRSADTLLERVGIDFSETGAVPSSPVLTRIEEYVSAADVGVGRASFVVADSASFEDEMTDAQLLEALERGLAVDESRSAGNASNMGAIDSPKAAAVFTSPVPARTDEGVPGEEVVVADSVSTDEKALDVQLSGELCGTLGVDESRSAHHVPKRDVTDSSEASAVPEVLMFTRLEEVDLPAGVQRASCVVADSIAGEESASDVKPPEEVLQELALDESRSAEIVAERDAIDSSGGGVVAASPVLVRREEGVPRVEVVVAGLMGNDEEMSNASVSDEPSQALPLDELRSTDIVIEGVAANLSEAAAEPASLVLIRTGEDVPLAEPSVEKEVGFCADAMVHSEQGKGHLLSFNCSGGQVFDERIQSPAQRLEIEKRCAEGHDGLIDAGTTLVSSCQAGLKQLRNANAYSVDAETILERSCKVDLKEMEDVDRDVVGLRENNLCEVIAAGTVVESSRQAAPKQTEIQNALFVEEQNDEMCDVHMTSSTENVPSKLKVGIDSTKFVLEKELDISNGGPVHSVHTELVKDDLNVNALVEKSSSLLPLPNEHMVSIEPHSTHEHLRSVSPCAEGRSEPLDPGSVVGSSWQAGPKHTEDRKGMVGREQEDNVCYIEALEDLMDQHTGATEEHLMGGGDGSDPQSCVGSVEITSTTAALHANGSLPIVECIHTDGRDHTEEKVEQERIFGGPEGSNEVIKQPDEIEQHNFDHLADELPEMQMAILPCLDTQTVNQGFVASGTSCESDELPPPELVVGELDIRNKEEKVPKGCVREIVNVATDLGNSGVPAGVQALSTSPEGLRHVILRDSDATVSESLESVQVSGAEFGATHQEAGKEVQSPLVMKAKDRHSRDAGDLENRHVTHPDDLEENEEQPYASPLNGTVNDQLVGAEIEVRAYKKKGRPRVYNHEKALQGTGRPHLQPAGSKRKRQLQYAGNNRWRRNRHVDPDQPVPVYIEGRDEVKADSYSGTIAPKGRSPDFYLPADDHRHKGIIQQLHGFEEAEGGAFSRWLAHQVKGNSTPSPAVRKRVRKHDQELVKPVIAIPSFRVVADYEDRQKALETRWKVEMQQRLAPNTQEMQTLMSSRAVRASDYDMDDEDETWLHAWNKRLARGGLKQPISEDKFEEMIEYFERMYAQLEVAPAGDFPGYPDGQKSLAHSVPGSFLPSTSPSGLGCLTTNPATSGIPVLENAPALNPPRIRFGHIPCSGGLKDVLSSGKQVVVSSAIRGDSIGRESASPASTILFHTLTSEYERNVCKSVADTVTEKPSEGLLQKSFEPSAEQQPSDDCCICNGGEDDETNPVYTCKRCLIHVHQSCYGIREKFRDDEGRVIAPPSWCCRKCEAVAVGTAQPNVSCVLCRKKGGALKPTVAPRKWAHVACALYTNETFFVDPDAMEPIDGIAAVAARAQDAQDRCRLCGVKRGICSLCAVKGCRAPFHISCGVSQGASFELRQSKQKVVGVRSYCPRHARTSMDSASSAGLKEGHLVSSSTTSGATASATASGSISTASSMDYREDWSSRQNTSGMGGSFVESARQATNVGTYVAALTDNVMRVTGKGTEDAGRGRPNSLRFTLKRRWDESCTQVSEDGVFSDPQKKSGTGRGVTGDKIDAPGCKSTWHVVEPGQKLKKTKFKFGKLAQNQDLESSPTLVQQERIGSKDPAAEKIKEVMPAVSEASGDAAGNDRDTAFVSFLSEDRFAKEVKELTILGEAMKSGVAPVHIMREAFVYWRAKRAEYKGSLLYELHHKQWSKSQGIFNKDGSDEGNLATGKMRVPLARQPSPVSTEKMLEKAKELREQLDCVRSMAQMVVQREKLKYNQELVLMTIVFAELNTTESIISGEQRCVWCPSTKTLLKCGTCLRSFCFNCFKNRKGFGVKGWMAASKQVSYICKYCRELSSNVADLSNNLDPVQEEIVDAGLVSTPVITSEPVRRGREKGMGKGRDEGWGLQRLDNPSPASLPLVGGGMLAPAKGLGIGRGKGNGWTISDNAGLGSSRRSSENEANNQSKPSELEIGLNKFLSITNDQMEHSSFETTLRRLKILRHKNKDVNQVLAMRSAEIPSGDIAEATADVRASGPVIDELKAVEPSSTNVGNMAVPVSPASGPALLVYKKNRRLILSASSESAPSAYDFADELNHPPSFPTGLENGTSERIMSPSGGVIAKRLVIGGLERIEDCSFYSGK